MSRLVYCIFGCLLLCLPVPSRAQHELVDRVQRRYHALTDLQADFKQTAQVAHLHSTIDYTGRILVQFPNKIRIHYTHPQQRDYISNGQLFWQYTAGDTQYIEQSIVDAPQTAALLGLLSQFASLQTHFTIAASTRNTLTLRPKAETHFTQLHCIFDRTALLNELIVELTNGGQSHFHFHNLQSKQKIDKSSFEFTPPAGVTKVR